MKGRWTIGVMVVLVMAACLGAPAVEAAKESHGETATAAATTGAVNINTASIKELMTLDGIGHKVAEKIVEYRTANGPFKKAEEIRKVQGIGGGLWEKNRDRIVVK